MSRLQILLTTFVAALLVSAAAGAGAWYYVYGGPEVAAAELVPADTLVLATIPNGTSLAAGYQTSKVQTLISSPNMKPVQDALVQALGSKNLDLIQTFAPNLSGQSFIAVTHFDMDHPDDVGLIAAMKPKAGLGNFPAFLDKLKAAYPDLLQGAKTGKGNVAGYDYDWLQGSTGPGKLLVANIKGWVVTTSNEATLQDWIERLDKKSTTPSLQDNADYKTSLARVGTNPGTLLYVNFPIIMTFVDKVLTKTNPAMVKVLDSKLKEYGGAMIASNFENGDIVDRYSFLVPRAAQLENGMSDTPCPFDTLKFTSRDTRLYMAGSVNWKTYYANIKEQLSADPNYQTMLGSLQPVQAILQQEGVDFEHNVIDALGGESSLQLEWNEDTLYPELGLFMKLDKPDDFKPVIGAILDTIRKQLATLAVIKEETVADHHFATLNLIQVPMISPTITEDGDYFGLFLTANQAVRSFQRDPTLTLASNEHFTAQIGDKRNGAIEVAYMDSPYMLNRAYKTALPYVSMASMFNPQLAGMLQGRQLPPDLTWLAPIGTWSAVGKTDDAGVTGYSVSGVGNQFIFLYGGVVGVAALEALGQQVKGVFNNIQQQSGAAASGGGSSVGTSPAPVVAPTPAPTPTPQAPAPAPAPAPVQAQTPPAPASAPAAPDTTPATNSPANAPASSPATTP